MQPFYDGFEADEELMRVKAQRDALLAVCKALLRAWDGYEMLAALDCDVYKQAVAAIAAVRPPETKGD